MTLNQEQNQERQLKWINEAERLGGGISWTYCTTSTERDSFRVSLVSLIPRRNRKELRRVNI